MSQKNATARLAKAVAQAHRNLEDYRENRLWVVKWTTGRNYGDKTAGTEEAVVLNLLAMFDQTVGRSIISKDPRLMLSTHRDADKPNVHLMQDWANQEFEAMRFGDILHRSVLDGFNSIGIAKVALSDPGDSARVGWNRPVGSAFVDRIDLDDWFVDLMARDFSEVSFEGHLFRIPIDVAMKRYGRAAKDLTPSERPETNSGGDERVTVLTPGERSDYEEYEDYCTLCEVYCPRQKRIKVFDWDSIVGGGSVGGEGLLEERGWVGPDWGPYHHLCFGTVPGNLLPLGPKQNLVDLHVSINGLLNKLIRQAQRQKSILPYAGADTRDVELLNSTADGHGFRVNAPEHLREVRFGGPDAANYQFMIALKELADWSAGNLSILGGLAPQSRTAAQDKMLNENSTRMVADLSGTTIRFVTDIANSLCWYWWHDPYKVMRSTWAPDGLPGLAVNRQLTPRDRLQTPWEYLRVKIDPYSLSHKTPESRLQFLNAVVDKLTPLTPILAEQGVYLDVQRYLQLIGEWGDEPEVPTVYRVQTPIQSEGGEGEGAGGLPHDRMMPANTTRTYDRRSTGGDTPQGRMADIGNDMEAAAASDSDSGGY